MVTGSRVADVRPSSMVGLGVALTVVGIGACDEGFVAPEKELDATIESVEWADSLIVGTKATYTVTVSDPSGQAIVAPSTTWTATSAAIEVEAGEDGVSAEVTGLQLGTGVVTIVFDQRPFSRLQYSDTIGVVLGGVGLVGSFTDSASVASISDTVIVKARGFDGNGAEVGGSGLQWQTGGQGVAVLEAFVGGDSTRVIAIGEGEDIIRVFHGGCLGSCTDTLHFSVAPSTASVTIDPPPETILVGDSIQLSAVGRDRSGTVVSDETFEWLSRAPGVADVTAAGLLVASDSGSATIVASASSGTADSVEVTVYPTGSVEIQLTDAPADYLEQAWLYTSGVFLSDPGAQAGRRYLEDAPAAYDLLTLRDGVTASLGVANMATGNLNRVFLSLDSVAVVLRPGYQFPDGSTRRRLPLPPSVQDSLSVDISTSVAVSHGDTSRVIVEVDVNRTFPLDQLPGQDGVVPGISFQPSPRASDLSRTGELSGSVGATTSADLTALLLQATRVGGADTLTTAVRSDGTYGFFFVEPGDYELTGLSLPACHVLNPLQLTRTVPVGGVVSDADLALDSVDVASIDFTSPRDSLFAISDTFLVAAVALDGAGAPVNGVGIAFDSDNPSVATVSTGGMVVSRGNGTVTLTASSCGVSTSVQLVVSQVPADVSITDPTGGILAMEENDIFQMSAAVRDSNDVAIGNASIQWSTSDAAVVTVDANGLVAATGPGSAEVTVQSGVLADTAAVSVLTPGLVARPLASGNAFTCDVSEQGGARCWGRNNSGQLGDGTIQNRSVPASLSGGIPLLSVTAGNEHACGLTPSGEAYCWGRNYEGQIGTGSTSPSEPIPVAVVGGNRFRDITAGYSFTCGLTLQNAVLCWGSDQQGQLGIGGGSGTQPSPVEVSGGRTYVALDIGGNNACAIGADQTTYCWGLLVVPSSVAPANVPTAVSGGTGFTSISVGPTHACAVDTQQDIYCWGQSSLGLGGAQSRSPTTPVEGFQSWVSVDAGRWFSCGRSDSGTSYCWGNNDDGRLGSGTRIWASSPQLVTGGADFTSLALGEDHACGRTQAGETYCWGYRGDGGVGDGAAAYGVLPSQIQSPAMRAVSAGSAHGCAIATSGQGYCWGLNRDGQVGDGTLVDRLSPTPIGLGQSLDQIAVSSDGSHSCAVTTTGDGYCWGSNGYGQLGDSTGARRPAPTPIAAGTMTWTTLAAGQNHSCGVAADSLAYCWGENSLGQLGDGSGQDQNWPTPVAGGHKFVSIAAANRATCALRVDGAMYCWGRNFSPVYGWGGVGDGTDVQRNTPVEVGAGTGFRSISGGGSGLFCGLATDDTAWCWVDGYRGKVGDGQGSYQNTPFAVLGGYTYQDVVAGPTHACGITTQGVVLCWGENGWGQLGTGTRVDQFSPQPAAGGLPLTEISAGSQSSCGVDATGQLYCWGWRQDARTGEGLGARQLYPVPVGPG